LVNQNIVLKVSLKSTQEIDDPVNKFINLIQTAAWDASTTPKPRKNYSPSIPEHIRLLITNKRKSRALYQCTRFPSHNAGVTQGGILSPILYNIYASDQPPFPYTQIVLSLDGFFPHVFHVKKKKSIITYSYCAYGHRLYISS
jgi:hypothetical protein